MTTMHRTSNDLAVWAPLLVAIVLVAAVLAGAVNGVDLSAPSIGFEPAGFPEATPDPVPAHVLEMGVYGETGVLIEVPPVHLIEEETAGG